jgi:hypothetical protein
LKSCRLNQPPISSLANHGAISGAAVCGAPEPWTEFSPMFGANSLRMAQR